MNDKSCDIEALESPTTTLVTDGPIRGTPIEDMWSRATPLEREHGTRKSAVYKGHKKVELSPVEGESLESPSTTSPKRVNKLRAERDVKFERGRTRSKTRAEKSMDGGLSI